MVVIYGGIIDELQWAGFSVEKVNWNKQVFMRQVFEEKKMCHIAESSRKENEKKNKVLKWQLSQCAVGYRLPMKKYIFIGMELAVAR